MEDKSGKPMGSFTFHRDERLKSQKSIQELFDKGSSFYLSPFKILFLGSPENSTHHQALFSVSKRSFKRAVDRNKIKRRIREGYRLNKLTIAGLSPKLLIAYIYTSREILPSAQIHVHVMAVLQKLKELHAKES
jgi:ribonuclease P protein component